MSQFSNATSANGLLLSNDDPIADTFVGILYVVISSLLVATYLPTIYVLLNDANTMKSSCFKIMISMSLCDVLQLVGIGLVGGIFTLTDSLGGTICNRVWGSIINTFWLINCLQGNVLAFNRCLSIWFHDWYLRLFDGKIVYVWITTAFLYGFCINIMYVSQSADLIYDPYGYIWYYNITDANWFCLVTEITQDYINEGMSLIFCIFIAIKLKKLRSSTTANALSKKDKSAIYQACWISMSLMFYNCVYFTVVNVTKNKWVIFTGNLLWILVNGQSPTVFMVFNEGLRKDIVNCGRRIAGRNMLTSPVGPASTVHRDRQTEKHFTTAHV